jgi:2-dehydro-3-deoxygluconokinase
VSGRLDVVAVGETMLSLVAVDGSLADASTFHATHGGAESNTCQELVRCGVRASWVSRLGDDPAGDRIVASLVSAGVDLSWVIRDATRPTGLMLRDTRGGVRYQRAGSAASRLSPEDLRDVPVEDARAVFTSAITPLLGRGPGETARELLRRAHGLRALDLNLRDGLWGSGRAAALIRPLLRSCDVAFGGVAELQAFADGATPAELARAMTRFGPAEVVVKRGREGAGALDPEGRWHEVPPVRVIEVDPVGAGDAFDAGYLAARLAGAEIAEALRAGAASGAAVAASIGDAAGGPSQK